MRQDTQHLATTQGPRDNAGRGPPHYQQSKQHEGTISARRATATATMSDRAVKQVPPKTTSVHDLLVRNLLLHRGTRRILGGTSPGAKGPAQRTRPGASDEGTRGRPRGEGSSRPDPVMGLGRRPNSSVRHPRKGCRTCRSKTNRGGARGMLCHRRLGLDRQTRTFTAAVAGHAKNRDSGSSGRCLKH